MKEDTVPTIVTKENEKQYVSRFLRHKQHKAYQKACDRRSNFEKGEYVGILYFGSLWLISVAASGNLDDYALPFWARVVVGVFGIAMLCGKTYRKRRFWKETEDAEHEDENDY